MLGIDIGSKSIKVVEIQKEGNNYILSASGTVGYSGTSIDKITEDSDLQAVADILKKVVSQIGVKVKDVNFSMPESQIFTRLIKFPLLSDAEIVSAVKWEAEQYIPIPVNEASIQHDIVFRDEKNNQVSVLLVATPKAVVEKYIKILRMAGLNPVAAETELTALSRSLIPDTGTFLLLDMGASSTSMAVVKDSIVVFTRSIPVGGEALTRAVSQSFNLTPLQAEEYKKTYGLSTKMLEGKVKTSLEPVFRMIIDEVKKAVHFYQTEDKGEPPRSLVISGGASTLPDIVSYLAENIGMETSLGNPYSKLTVDKETLKQLSLYAQFYGIAVGLGLREE